MARVQSRDGLVIISMGAILSIAQRSISWLDKHISSQAQVLGSELDFEQPKLKVNSQSCRARCATVRLRCMRLFIATYGSANGLSPFENSFPFDGCIYLSIGDVVLWNLRLLNRETQKENGSHGWQ